MASKIITAYIYPTKVFQGRKVKLSIVSHEISPIDVAELFSFQGKYCKVLITSANVISSQVINATEDLEIDNTEKQKTQSARIRSVLYLLFKKFPEQHDTFESFYNKKTNLLIEHYKSKLK
jgi:hypothetical protein